MMKLVILICWAIIASNALPAGKESDRENEIEQLVNRSDDSTISSTASAYRPDDIRGTSIPPYGAVNGSVGVDIPKPPGTMFARIIDDIFQIPIAILQSVSKLLTNPFKAATVTQVSPEDSHKY